MKPSICYIVALFFVASSCNEQDFTGGNNGNSSKTNSAGQYGQNGAGGGNGVGQNGNGDPTNPYGANGIGTSLAGYSCDVDTTFNTPESANFWEVQSINCSSSAQPSSGLFNIGPCKDQTGVKLTIPTGKCKLRKDSTVHIEVVASNDTWGDDSPLVGIWVGPGGGSTVPAHLWAAGPSSSFSDSSNKPLGNRWVIGKEYMTMPVYQVGPAAGPGKYRYVMDLSKNNVHFVSTNANSGAVAADLTATLPVGDSSVRDGDTVGFYCAEAHCSIEQIKIKVTN